MYILILKVGDNMQSASEISRLLERAERSLVQVIAYESRDINHVVELQHQAERISNNIQRIARNMKVIDNR